MENSEVICISSDDEDIEQNKVNRGEKSVITQLKNSCIEQEKIKISMEDSMEVSTCTQKRKAIHLEDSITNSQECKKVFVCEKQNSENTGDNNYNDKEEEEGKKEQDTNAEKTILKPKLVVKEKKIISQIEQDVFPMFISLCLQKDRCDDMKIIVNKLKRRYEQLDPAYVNSEAFINFLNEKRNDIMNSRSKLYVYIAEVNKTMKKHKGKSTLLLNGKNSQLSDTSHLNNSYINNTTSKITETDNEEHLATDDVTQRKINIILKTMKKCEKCIKRLEESEMNFDEENNSNYIKLNRYKQRMVELYNKYCEYTGENTDAGRSHLRPKHFSTTGIVTVDQVITSFINSKLSKNHKLKKIGACTNALIFPDYTDILKCVTACNERHNLGLSDTKQQQIARKAFVELGEHLQRSRRNDYWDTFSLALENNEDDPAIKDPELSAQLLENRAIGEKRLANVFEEYVKKQEQMKEEDLDDKALAESDKDDDVSTENEDEEDSECNNTKDGDGSSIDKDNTSTDEDGNSIDKDEISISNSVDEKESDSDVIEVNETEQIVNCEKLKDRNDSDINTVPRSVIISTSKCKDVHTPESAEISNTILISDKVSPKSATSPTVLSTVTNNSIQMKEDETINNNQKSINNKSAEDERPLLRVCSFAKPPMTWEDINQKKSIRTNALDTSVNNDTVDLTKEIQKENSIVTKCGINKMEANIITMRRNKI